MRKRLVIILIVSLLFIPIVHAGNDMITIHPPGNHSSEEVFFINGTTTLPAGKTLVIDIEPVRLHPAPSHDPPKNTTALTGQVITEKSTGGISQWSYVVGSASLIPDDYTIHVTSFGPPTIESSADFTIQPQNGTNPGTDQKPARMIPVQATVPQTSMKAPADPVIPVLALVGYALAIIVFWKSENQTFFL
jgi:hypothetical protein